MTKFRDISSKLSIPKAETELALDPNQVPIGQLSGGLFQFSDSFRRGYGNNVFGNDANGLWLGAADYDSAPFRVDYEGNLYASKATIVGAAVNFVSTLVWTSLATNAAGWSSGIIKTSEGTTYAIDAGSVTGITVSVYVYLDLNVSITELQFSTDPADAAGNRVLLVAILTPASGTATECSIDVIGGKGTIITGSQIAAASITATELSVSSLSAISANLGTVTAGSMSGVNIAIGSGNSIFKADSNGIYLGNATYESAPFRVSMAGAVTATSLTLTNASIGSGSSYAGNQISESYIGNLSASKITAGDIAAARIQANVVTALQAVISTLSAITANVGTLTAGTINGVTINMPNESLGTGSSGKLKWESDARIWGDSSGRIGINGHGSSDGIYMYCADTEVLVLYSNAQAVFHKGIHLDSSSNLNVDGDTALNNTRFDQNGSADGNSLDKIYYIKGKRGLNFQLGNNSYWFSWYESGGNEKMYLKSNGDWHVTGSKSSDVELANGNSVSLFAVEAPDVWFMDFTKSKEKIDPIFLETVEGDLHFIKCEGGEYLVFGHRKGYEDKRFPLVDKQKHLEKSQQIADFLANNSNEKTILKDIKK